MTIYLKVKLEDEKYSSLRTEKYFTVCCHYRMCKDIIKTTFLKTGLEVTISVLSIETLLGKTEVKPQKKNAAELATPKNLLHWMSSHEKLKGNRGKLWDIKTYI